MTYEWKTAFALWGLAGLALLAAYLIWYVRQPKVTRFEWSNGQIDYFAGRVELEDLKHGGLYQATHFDLKDRTVFAESDLRLR